MISNFSLKKKCICTIIMSIIVYVMMFSNNVLAMENYENNTETMTSEQPTSEQLTSEQQVSKDKLLRGINKVDGKWHYYNPKNGRLVEKAGWIKVKKKKYYIKKGGTLATGVTKIRNKLYGFMNNGELRGFSKPFKFKGKWYRTNKKGEAEKLSTLQVKCSKQTWKYIDKYTSSKMSNKNRFRSLFYTLIAGNYTMGYIERREVEKKNFQYRVAYKVFVNNGKYNCYGFACSVASIAKELGYEPYVIVMDEDHAVVMIDGKYYDNMGGRFGAKEPMLKNYKVYQKVKF